LFSESSSSDSEDSDDSDSKDSGTKIKYKNLFLETVGKDTFACYSIDGDRDHIRISLGDCMFNRVVVEAKYLNRWISVLKALKSRLIKTSFFPAQE
jgi:hypothetical protein